MKNKLDKYTIKQVKLDFCKTESWLKTRKLIKESKCENCGLFHKDCDGEIALATIEGRINAHLCKSCGKYFIEKGAIDVNNTIAKNNINKEKLIKQAERVGHRFNTYWNKKDGADYTVKELKNLIKQRIESSRNSIHNMLDYKHLPILKTFVNAYNIANPKHNITYLYAFENPYDLLSDYYTDTNYEHHRWYSSFDATLKLGDKTFGYQWANANGDNSLEDAGFNISDTWSTMTENAIKDHIDVKSRILTNIKNMINLGDEYTDGEVVDMIAEYIEKELKDE